jgi:hypothetical protein
MPTDLWSSSWGAGQTIQGWVIREMRNSTITTLRCEESYQGDQIKMPAIGAAVLDFFRGFTSSYTGPRTEYDTPWGRATYQARALANDVYCIWREWRYWSRFHNFRGIK